MKAIEQTMLRKEWHNINRYFTVRKTVKKYIPQSKKHLDFGCGFGCMPYLLSKDFPQLIVVGVDKDKNAINEGKKRYKADNFNLSASKNIKGNFDSISCFNVLHHIENVEEYLNKLYSILNPKGRIIIIDFRKVSKEKFKKEYYNLRIAELKNSKNKTFNLESFEEEYRRHNRWNMKEFVSMLENTGFKTLEVKLESLQLVYAGEKK